MVVGELPSGSVGGTAPVVVVTIVVARLPNAAVGIVAAGGIVAIACTAGVPGVICGMGVAQVTTVPGVVGSNASGTGASVVSGAPGWIVAEKGLGPLSGEVTIVAGVEGRPMAVVPMVETCARQALAPSSSVAIVNSKRCITIAAPNLSASCYAPRPWLLPPG
jgi:hypothetical protein